VTEKVRQLLSVDMGNGIIVHVAPAGRRWHVSPVAFVVGLVLGVVALLRLGITPHGVLAAALLLVLSVLATIDIRSRLLPNMIVLPALGAVLLWQFAFFGDRAAEWLLAAGGAALFLMIPSLLIAGAMGMGDVKLGALLGAALGAAVVPALALGSLAVLPVSLVLLARDGRAARRATLPFGPFLAFGAALVILTA